MLHCVWRLLFVVVLATASTAFAQVGASSALHVEGDVALTHDPSIARDGRTYYVFATGKAPGGGQLPIRCSDDLDRWRLCGRVFDQVPGWIRQTSPGTEDLWAPDISFSHGEYRLYYAYSIFGKNLSGIALATNKTLDPARPDYKWVDRGLVLRSTVADDFNAIDPATIEDSSGRLWMAFGSFWSGIKMRELDPAAGKLLGSNARVYDLAARLKPVDATPAKPGLPPDYQAVEAPSLIAHGGFFYLFVSWDLCCRGTKSTYRTMVGRSRVVTGPYLDRTGRSMAEGGGSSLMEANGVWLGPGGASALLQASGRADLLVFHAYSARSGRPRLQISTIGGATAGRGLRSRRSPWPKTNQIRTIRPTSLRPERRPGSPATGRRRRVGTKHLRNSRLPGPAFASCRPLARRRLASPLRLAWRCTSPAPAGLRMCVRACGRAV